jgi:hypothetical protein
MNHIKFILLGINLFLSSGCNRYFGSLGSNYVLLNTGVTGKKVILLREKIFKIDSLFINSDKFWIDSFTLDIKSLHGVRRFQSISNKLNGKMKMKIVDDPTIEKLVFKNIHIHGLKKITKIRNRKIKIVVADY